MHRKTLHHYNTTGHAHELTFSCYHRLDYLLDTSACEIFIGVLSEARELYHLRIWAYVLMPNHVHLLIWPLQKDYDIAKIESGIKGISSKRYKKYLLENVPEKCQVFNVVSHGVETFRLWQPGGGFDRNLWNPLAIHRSIGYIEANPVRKRLVAEPALWSWSSAFARVNKIGMIPDTCGIPVDLPDHQRQFVGAV